MDGSGTTSASDLSVSVNTQQADPIYWGSFGPDIGAIATSANGRVCFMNLEKGIHEFKVSDADGVISSFTYPIFKGFHAEEDIFIENKDEGKLIHLSSLASANEQLYSDEQDSSVIRAVDDGDIVELSINESLEKVGNGTYKLTSSTAVKGRRYLLNKSAEFSDSIHTIDDERSDVLTLVHRGFF